MNKPTKDELQQLGNMLMRSASGNVNGDDRLVAFLYILARDHVTTGKLDEMMLNNIEGVPFGTVTEYTNGWLAQWAMDCAERIRGEDIVLGEPKPNRGER